MLASEQQYLRRNAGRFAGFAGSDENFEALVLGLRRGEPVALGGGENRVRFTPPTRPMGYGNITRALDLASRQLAAAGIAEPTPREIQAALIGGTVDGPGGDVTVQGILTLRSEGMGWGRIAHAVGVHPGLGVTRPAAPPVTPGAVPHAFRAPEAPPAGAKGITTALGGSAPPTTAARASLVRGTGEPSAGQPEIVQRARGDGRAHSAGKR